MDLTNPRPQSAGVSAALRTTPWACGVVVAPVPAGVEEPPTGSSPPTARSSTTSPGATITAAPTATSTGLRGKRRPEGRRPEPSPGPGPGPGPGPDPARDPGPGGGGGDSAPDGGPVGGCEVTVDPYQRQPRRRAADRVDRAAAPRLFARP
ncbi:hypothetical protein ACWGF2_00835 [Streptomyces sp. NPDC054919]